MLDVEIEKDRQRPVRQNGLVNGMNLYQIISWSYTLYDAILTYYFAFYLPYDGPRELFLVITTVIVVILIYTCLRTTLTNTIDPIVQQEQELLQAKNLKLILKDIVQFVKHMSKKGLNIAKAVINVQHYLIIIVYGQITVSQEIIILISSFQLYHQYALRLLKYHKSTHQNFYIFSIYFLVHPTDLQVLILVSISIDTPTFLVLTYLLGMHCYFRANNMTTYDFIKKKRERNTTKDKPTHKANESVGYGQLLSTSKRFDLKSKLALQSETKSTQFFPSTTSQQTQVKKTSPSSAQQIPSLFNTKPQTPQNNNNLHQYPPEKEKTLAQPTSQEQQQLAQPQKKSSSKMAKDLEDLKVIIEDSEPPHNESSEESARDMDKDIKVDILSNGDTPHAQQPPQECYTFQMEQPKSISPVEFTKKTSQLNADSQTE